MEPLNYKHMNETFVLLLSLRVWGFENGEKNAGHY